MPFQRHLTLFCIQSTSRRFTSLCNPPGPAPRPPLGHTLILKPLQLHSLRCYQQNLLLPFAKTTGQRNRKFNFIFMFLLPVPACPARPACPVVRNQPPTRRQSHPKTLNACHFVLFIFSAVSFSPRTVFAKNLIIENTLAARKVERQQLKSTPRQKQFGKGKKKNRKKTEKEEYLSHCYLCWLTLNIANRSKLYVGPQLPQHYLL